SSLTNGREDYQLRVKSNPSQNPPQKVPFSKSEENGRTVYRWQHSNLSRPSESENSKKKTARAETKHPDVELTTFENWGELAQWYAKLESGRIEPPPEIRRKPPDWFKAGKKGSKKSNRC